MLDRLPKISAFEIAVLWNAATSKNVIWVPSMLTFDSVTKGF
jgi:hypothetical protein